MIALTVEPEANSSQSETPEPPRRKGEADLSLLEDRAPAWARMSRSSAGLIAGLGLLFACASFLPLWHTDVWGHLSYGRWIVQNKALPPTEPMLPLCEGVRFIDTAWLSQVAAYLAEKQLGVTALQFLFAACVTFCAAALAYLASKRSGSNLAGALAAGTFLFVDYQQLIIARPQLAGMVCFMVVFGILTAQRWRPSFWIAMPVTFAFWANLHGSFLMGLLLIACFVAGRAVDLVRRTGTTQALWRDAMLRRHFLLFQLSAAAVLLNPYGLELYFETFRIAANRNLQDLVDWDPLTFRMSQGKAAAIALVALIAALRCSPRRVSAAEALSLTIFGLGACYSSRIIVWWAPLCAWSLAIHAEAALRKWRQLDSRPAPPRSGLSTVAAIGIMWIAFAYSPFGMRVIHGAPKTPEDAARRLKSSVSIQTAVAAAAYLNEHPPVGQCFNTYEWGDYLLWAGPANARWFVASHAHLVPREVWEDYLRIVSLSRDWEGRLDRYGINTVVLERNMSADLVRALKEKSHDWSLEYEDHVTAIFARKRPI
ncbi:hypothetical protein Pan44_05750 [Caulifigura coniformis]|uniref:Glycosyltransferase RgtA/B/C/D-like domain-containing protein n=1 Tax=Caulifigura coniformis TaxID=2527983 RepID=A0A517S8Y1_9PLAN|nr:hypothetical protein [Caulifigura coniformis]QDT52563.1 hypothetical protein Pan44_05750 [Caulifigura coniformis]